MATTNFRHIRRCHVCGTVNEVENGAVHKCSACRKHLAPFYYFEESELQGIGDNELEMSLWNKRSVYHPLWGFSTYWEDSSEDTG